MSLLLSPKPNKKVNGYISERHNDESSSIKKIIYSDSKNGSIPPLKDINPDFSTETESDIADNIWSKFIDLLSQSLKENEIETWFSVLRPKSYIDNILTIVVPSKDYYGIIEKRFNKEISNIINSGILGEGGNIQYEVNESGIDNQMPETENEEFFSTTKPYENQKFLPGKESNHIYRTDAFIIDRNKEGIYKDANLYGKYTFNNFVRGESNNLAVSIAFAISNNPGIIYNPFLVYGGVGVGKTHLIQAIGFEILKIFPDKKVYYTTAPDFTTQFTTYIAKDKISSSGRDGTRKLDSFYKSLDVLILDDIQNLGGKPGTQDFIYQIFNTLYNNKKHIIFSSDKPVNQIKDIEERLISRFQGGIIVDIQPPCWEMRVAIIRKKLENAVDNNIVISEDAVHFIATNVKESIRAIEACVAGIIAEATFNNHGVINIDVVEKVIERTSGFIKNDKNISIESIIHKVAKFYKITEKEILSKKRTKEVAHSRQIAMYLAKEMTSLTLESIGLNFGGKDHATVLYSYNTIKNLLKNNSNLVSQIQDIKDQLRANN